MGKISNLINKKFNNDPVYNNKYIYKYKNKIIQ